MKYDVCVFGGCALDQIYYQKSDGTYDENPNVIAPGGKGANQAVAASRAGARTTIITKLGKDDIGNNILENLRFNMIDTSNVILVDNLENDHSNIYIKIKDKDNEIKRFNGAINSFTESMVDDYKDVLLNSKIIVCQLKTPKKVTEKLINFCYDNNKFLILTPCRPEKLKITDKNNKKLIDKINIITCNKTECETIFETDDIYECVKKYPNKLIVTLGGDGVIYSDGTKVIHMPAIKVDVLDTIGAGDTLNGNLSASLAKGLDLKHALRRATYASAMKVMIKSAQTGMPYSDDLDNFIINNRNKDFNYQEELKYAITIVKKAYEKIKDNNNFIIYEKPNNTLVTEADLLIEKYLVDKIKEKYPNDKFLTEENYHDRELDNRTWIIDPIDGTTHFIKKDGFWGIQLAFYDNNDTRFAIIYLPEKEELYYGAEHNGVYINNNRIFSSPPTPINQSIVEFGGSLHNQKEEKLSILNNLMPKDKLIVSNVLHINTCSISYTNLISGKTDALIMSVDRPWEIMPGQFLCKELNIDIIYLDFDKKLKLITANNELKEIILSKK